MRALTIFVLAASLTLVGCDGNPPTGEPPTEEPPTGKPPTGEPPADGTLVVSTSTIGDDPDPDGYLLVVDNADSLDLRPTGSAQIDLALGRHSLELRGVARHCSVVPGTSVVVYIAPEHATPVDFEFDCPLTGARITVTTTGGSRDPDGYRVIVDGSDHGVIASNGTVLVRLEPGSRTIGLTGLAQNCAVHGSSLRAVTIVAAEAVGLEFAVVCTALDGSGVIKVVLSGALGLGFEGVVDGVTRFPIGDPGRGLFVGFGRYAGVPAGTHVVSLSAPDDCSTEPGPQSVTFPEGASLRDTVEINFVVTCVSGLRIITRATGASAGSYASAYLCTDPYCDGLPFYLGRVGSNDTLVFKAETDTYRVGFNMSIRNCELVQNPPDPIQFVRGTTLDVMFQITCK